MNKDIDILCDTITELVKETKFAEEKIIHWTEESVRLKQLHRILLEAYKRMRDDPR